MEIVVVGHLSRDLLITPDMTRETLGGGTAYAMLAPALGALGSAIVTRVGQDFESEYMEILKSSVLDLTGLRTSGLKSTRFINEYDKNGNCTQRVENQAPIIRGLDYLSQHLHASIFHFCPLLQEVHVSCIEAARNTGAFISVDIQGYLRSLNGDNVIPTSWDDHEDVLGLVDFVKCDEDELALVHNAKSEVAAVTHILDLGPRIVAVTRNRKGATIYTKNRHIEIPLVLGARLVDSTGCGDTFAIGFLLEYMRTGDVTRAGLFGATCASFNIENVGPYMMPSRNQVDHRMKAYLQS
ncbi:MAG: carbohydrate kinase family protein [Candidatus Thorarchaeota archaeon]